MNRYAVPLGALVVFLTASGAWAQQAVVANRMELGKLANGASVIFVHEGTEWGIEISGGTAPRVSQAKPVEIEIYRGANNVSNVAGGYRSVVIQGASILQGAYAVATAKVGEGTAAFEVEDRWTVKGAVLALNRKVSVTGAEDGAGFYSAIRLATAPTMKWEDATYFVPGMSYGDPANDGSAAATRAKRFSLREDTMAAPLIGMAMKDGNWAAVLGLAPKGETTAAENSGGAGAIIEERMQFGAVGCRELTAGGIELGFNYPGTVVDAGGMGRGRGGAPGGMPGGGARGPVGSAPGGATRGPGGGAATGAAPVNVRGRYHPVKAGFAQSYQVGFRFDKSPSFREMERDAWRWAWESLKPKAKTIDVEVARKVMLDHLSDHVISAGEFIGVPFLIDAVTGHPGSYRTPAPRGPDGRPPASALANRTGGGRPWNELTFEEGKKLAEWAKPMGIDVDPEAHELGLWMKVMSGFTSKAIESADQLLIESDRDPSPRGQKMRQQGLAIINSFVTKVSLGPPNGAGFNFYRAQVVYAPPDTLFLRQFGEDPVTLLNTYAREKKAGRNHPEWLAWVKKAADWLLPQQSAEGAFPRSWNAPEVSVKEASGTSSYNVVPMLARLSQETGEKKYLEAAEKAGEYVWTNYGVKGEYIGGTTDNPNVTDKEAGMLAMEGYLVLYEVTKDAKWLERAKAAGDNAESYIWIWNEPMPLDVDYATIGWKKGESTVGMQGITARGGSGVDTYLSWAVPCYARLYKYTQDEHYLDVARVLLHGSMAMLAMPGKTWDLVGPGWQQEGWRMGPGRGVGGHRSWLPWVSDNHLHGMTALEEFDPALYKKLASGE